MNKKQPGFLTTSGSIAAVLTILVVTGISVFSGGVLFSPGPLSTQTGGILGGVTAHAELANQCSACHTAFWDKASMADRCVVCHTDIPAQWTDTSKLHGNLHANNPVLVCRDCHPEHRGQNSLLTDMSKVKIDHSKFGYALTAHAAKANGDAFTCTDCHGNNSYLNFDQAICDTCHQQTQADFMLGHVNAYGTKCLDCHDGVETYGHAFDHSLAAFPLTGKHAQVACDKCHTGEHTIAAMKATVQDCNGCHAKDDAHHGELGINCAGCHTTAGWSPSTYDHNLSIFKLAGKHAQVACKDCHINNQFKGTPTDCFACHSKDDVHQTQLGQSCESCHTVDGWKPANFNHDSAAFKLTGAHVTVACNGCHTDLLFKNTPSDCNSCHSKSDVHNGQLGPNCATCHTTSGWTPSTFDHNAASFKLTGKHVGLACTSCHTDKTFKGAPSACGSCHAKDDAHGGQFGTGCGSCHSTNGWLPATFDHNLSGFKLIGKHASVSCNSCHINGVFKGTPTNCYACHAKDDNHGGQFGTNCGSCHTPNGWTPATFDHSIVFPLTGAHAGLSCNSCHKSGGFGGLSSSCASCHADPAFHAGLFSGTPCNNCHNTSSWTPAKYTGSHPGGCDGNCINHENASCRDCHTTNLMTATCTKCHDSNNPGGGD